MKILIRDLKARYIGEAQLPHELRPDIFNTMELIHVTVLHTCGSGLGDGRAHTQTITCQI